MSVNILYTHMFSDSIVKDQDLVLSNESLLRQHPRIMEYVGEKLIPIILSWWLGVDSPQVFESTCWDWTVYYIL